MQFVSPYLNFKGNAEEAFEFYRSVFGGEYTGVVRFRDFGEDAMGVPEADRDKIAHISLPLVGDVSLMASDAVGPQADAFTAGNNVYIYLETDTAEEADRLFDALSVGGVAEMPLQPTAWAEKYGSCIDRFGVQWMLSFTGDVQFSL
jgi:PhnB protein